MYISYYNDLGTTPARVNRSTGEIMINLKTWGKYTPEIKKIILGHEAGHYKLNTTDEIAADQYAFNLFAGKAPHSLKDSVFALSRVLSFKNPEHYLRLLEQVKRALYYDWKHNKNQLARKELIKLNNISTMNYNNPYENSYSDFLGGKVGKFFKSKAGRIIAGIATGGASELTRGTAKGVKKLVANKKAPAAEQKAEETKEMVLKDTQEEAPKLLGMEKKKAMLVIAAVIAIVITIIAYLTVKRHA